MRTIRVTGAGRLKVAPDTTNVEASLTGVCEDYAEALRLCAEKTAKLRALFSDCGVANEPKTVHYGVDAEYEGVEENGVWKNRFRGYRYRHTLKATFPNDPAVLGRLLGRLCVSDVSPEFGVSYTVKDPEAVRASLLKAAVEDAKKKAAVLAEAAGVRLKFIRCISYGKNEPDFTLRPVRLAKAMGAFDASNEAALDPGVSPEDLTLTDEVTLLWEIDS